MVSISSTSEEVQRIVVPENPKGCVPFPLVQLPKKFRVGVVISLSPTDERFPLVQLPKKFRASCLIDL